MWLLNLFRRKKEATSTTSKALGKRLPEIAEYIPERYRKDMQFLNYEIFLKNHEWGLALDSLIELANESGHYFSDAFWSELGACAFEMHMYAEGEYCMEQIAGNKAELGGSVPRGRTIEKIEGKPSITYVAKKFEGG